MMRRLVWGCVAVGFVTACGGLGGGERCDPAALKAAAAAAERATQAWSPATGVVPDPSAAASGVWKACPGLPPGLRSYVDMAVIHPLSADGGFAAPEGPAPGDPVEALMPGHGKTHGTQIFGDPATMAVLEQVCPGQAEIANRLSAASASARTATTYEACGFAGQGLVAPDELSPWLDDVAGRGGHALHRWLLDGGAPPEVARGLVRPLIAATEAAPRWFPPDLRLPAAGSVPPTPDHAMFLYVTPTGITFDGKQLVRLDRGALAAHDLVDGRVQSLFEALTDEVDRATQLRALTEDRAPVVIALAVDPQITWATAGPLVRSVQDAHADRVEAVALASSPMRPLVRVPLVNFAAGVDAKLSLELTAAGLTLRCEAGPQTATPAELAATVARCGGGPLHLTVADEVPWQRIVEAAAALAGAAEIRVSGAAKDPGQAR